jgi:hypothetical protein
MGNSSIVSIHVTYLLEGGEEEGGMSKSSIASIHITYKLEGREEKEWDENTVKMKYLQTLTKYGY